MKSEKIHAGLCLLAPGPELPKPLKFPKCKSIFCSNIWSLTHSSEMPWNFLGDRSVFCSKKATLGGFLNMLHHGDCYQEAQTMTRSWELSVPPSILWEGSERGWKLSE